MTYMCRLTAKSIGVAIALTVGLQVPVAEQQQLEPHLTVGISRLSRSDDHTIAYDNRFAPGEGFYFEFVVHNTGNAVSEETRLRVYRAHEVKGLLRRIAAYTIGPLRPDPRPPWVTAPLPFYQEVTLGQNLSSSGFYWYVACVHRTERFFFSCTADDLEEDLVRIQVGLPDLVARFKESSITVRSGATFTTELIIANEGVGRIRPARVTKWHDDTPIREVQLLRSVQIESSPDGAHRVFENYTATRPRTWELRKCVYTDQAEVTDRNNCATMRITVTGRNGTTTFTDDPIQPGTTTIRAVHFRELRERIAALRAQAGLPAIRWTDPMLTPGVTPVRAVHIVELRAALDAVYDAKRRRRPHYTDRALASATTVIKADHLTELRAATVALE